MHHNEHDIEYLTWCGQVLYLLTVLLKPIQSRLSDFTRPGGTGVEHQASSPQFVQGVPSALLTRPPNPFLTLKLTILDRLHSQVSSILAFCTVAGHMNHDADL